MPATMGSAIHLTILRKGDTNIIDLDAVDALIPRSETQVDSTFLQELATEVMYLATSGHTRGPSNSLVNTINHEGNAAVKDLQRVGSLIFSHLLTEPARKRLRMSDPCELYLRLDEQLIHVPWELCHDGETFLATKFRVGRQVITGYPIPTAPVRQAPQTSLRVLIIADPTESLPEAGHEAERLALLLDKVPGVEVTVLGGKGAQKVPLLTALQDHDVVHFAGHSYYDPETPSKSGWRLHEGILTAGELSKLSQPPLLVFSNSCQAGTTAEWTPGYRYEGQAFGIGSAFLLAGVKNYIGTFWVIHDEESVLFAGAFYQRLVAGLRLGEALLQARHAVIQQHGWSGLTWASYMLYGDPAVTVFPRATPHGEEAPLSPSSVQTNVPTSPLHLNAGLPHHSTTVPHKRRDLQRIVLRTVGIITAIAALFFAIFHFFPAATPQHHAYENALTLLRTNDIDRAFAAFQALVTDPANTNSLGYDGLAAIYFEKGLLAQAKEATHKALTTNAASSLALLTEGDIAFSIGEREKAADAYQKATLDKQNLPWLIALAENAAGVSSAMEGQVATAQARFQAALQVDPASVEAYSNLGYLAWTQGNLAEAQRFYSRAQTIHPDDELGRLLTLMLSPLSQKISPSVTNERILVIPFVTSGGSVRRLGEGWALVQQFRQQLPSTFASMLPPHVAVGDLISEGETSSIIALAKEQDVTAVVWGEVQIYTHKLIVYGRIWTRRNDSVTRVNSIQEGETEKITSAARALAEQVVQTLTPSEVTQ